MDYLGFTEYLADHNVWTCPAIKANGQEYYEHVLLYTEDALVESD